MSEVVQEAADEVRPPALVVIRIAAFIMVKEEPFERDLFNAGYRIETNATVVALLCAVIQEKDVKMRDGRGCLVTP